jgi:hypothetical protein
MKTSIISFCSLLLLVSISFSATAQTTKIGKLKIEKKSRSAQQPRQTQAVNKPGELEGNKTPQGTSYRDSLHG